MNNKFLSAFLILVSTFVFVVNVFSETGIKSDQPWTKWGKVIPLDGGKNFKEPKPVPKFDQWYSGELKGSFKWFSVTVQKSKTYEIYWDDSSEGSKQYKGDIVVWALRPDGKTKYDSKDKGYTSPISLVAKDTTIFIMIQAFENGSFAFGIREKK
jgi:hypothetical protein